MGRDEDELWGRWTRRRGLQRLYYLCTFCSTIVAVRTARVLCPIAPFRQIDASLSYRIQHKSVWEISFSAKFLRVQSQE